MVESTRVTVGLDGVARSIRVAACSGRRVAAGADAAYDEEAFEFCWVTGRGFAAAMRSAQSAVAARDMSSTETCRLVASCASQRTAAGSKH